ncbi:MAG: hypothetical protein LH618_15980 [Saprospiraceae bacterium]|nr:hypothetical protein [Saprospiraceae bacterium]
MKPIFLFLAFALFGTSCSLSFYYRPAANQPDQTTVVYNQGVPSLSALVPGAEVSTDLTSQGQSMLNLGVFVRNEGDSLVTFLPEGVRVYGYNAKGQRKEYRVFTAEQFIRRRNRQNALIAGAIVVATVATVVAVNNDVSNGANVDSGNAPRYNQNNNNWWWWAWSAPSLWIGPNGPREPYSSSDGLLRTQTLYSGESVQGLIKVKSDPEFRHKIVVKVPINGVYAEFVFGKMERRY